LSRSEFAYRLLSVEHAEADKLRVRDSHVTTPAGTVLHGIDREGRLHLLVPVAGDHSVTPDRRSAGVHLLPAVLESDLQRSAYLDVACVLEHLQPVFMTLADEMLEEIERSPAEALQVSLAVVDRWRELLGRSRSGLLGEDALTGLIGELVMLSALADHEPVGALDAWSGPLGHRFDFVSGSTSLEVKTTTAREGRSVEIHGVQQLEPLPDGRLYLAFVRLELRPAGTVTAPELVDALLTAHVPRGPLLERLHRVGFSLADRSVYDEMRYDVTEQHIYFVYEGFPRIVQGSFARGVMPAGVSSLRYRIDLSGPSPVALTAEEASAALRLIAGGTE
jgi:hypothetical protein